MSINYVEREGKRLIIPTIHLNGTSPCRLIDALDQASEALEDAYQKLKRTAPNGRDYYPQGTEALPIAEREHLSRLQRIDDVKREIESLILAIDDCDGAL